jgi:hypothetical protein
MTAPDLTISRPNPRLEGFIANTSHYTSGWRSAGERGRMDRGGARSLDWFRGEMPSGLVVSATATSRVHTRWPTTE